MEELLYYPGCSLKDTAIGFEESAIYASRQLGIELKEMERWNCCGTVYSLTADNLMKQLGPVRNLVHAQEEGYEKVYTLCSMCDNTLKRSNRLVKNDPEKLEKINSFMDREEDYLGEVTVKHYLELLRDELGWDAVREPVREPLKGLNVAPYYGCMLTRPKEIGLDDPHNPTVLEDFISSLGAEPVDYPYHSECCGSYNTVEKKDIVLKQAGKITSSAAAAGADLIITSCPLCHYNLDTRQSEYIRRENSSKPVPVLYITQLMAVAYGNSDVCKFDKHAIDPREALALENKALKER
ncbi:CoB--CoM heterodisulfide reductase iron-sulfur subunit B family protein [Candidatus Bipolaricaulota bacterium]|nr:CoB--CoM heterodisulfide reductase iron-sulfur subunit B family protein [Candidatus Bipolaricaulota bacterium]